MVYTHPPNCAYDITREVNCLSFRDAWNLGFTERRSKVLRDRIEGCIAGVMVKTSRVFAHVRRHVEIKTWDEIETISNAF